MVVQGFKSVKNSKSKFRLVDNDISIRDHNEVIECLPVPKFDNKDVLFFFSRNVNIAEK